MNALLRPLPLPALTPVEQMQDCARCEGTGEVCHPRDEWKWGNDPSIRSVTCPECDGECVTENPDWEPGLMVCGCGHAWMPGEQCSKCGAAP